MSQLEPRIEAIRKEYGLSADDFWQIKQNKQWVCKHAALEVVAVKAGIVWGETQIIEQDAANLVTSMIVYGTKGDRTEWATGETNPSNYSVSGKQPAYPWAMSEKRAKDRVILKLVGIHGLVYSDAEMDAESDREVTASKPTYFPKQAMDKHFAVIRDELFSCTTIQQLENAWERHAPVIALFDEHYADGIAEQKAIVRKHIEEGKEGADPIEEALNAADVARSGRNAVEGRLRACMTMDQLRDEWKASWPAIELMTDADSKFVEGVKEEMKATIAKVGSTPQQYLDRLAKG